MKLRVLSAAVFTGLVSQIAFAEAAEDVCKQFGGDRTCVEPIPPHVDGDWVYRISNSQQIYPGQYNSLESALAKRPTGALGGEWLSLTCHDQPCDAKGTGVVTKELGLVYEYPTYVPASEASIYNYFYAESQMRPLFYPDRFIDGTQYFSGDRITRDRPIAPFLCPTGTVQVGFKDLSHSASLPFSCALPAKPNRCEIKINNPISDSCGNPIDFTSGNKTQSETDWSSPNSPLKVTRLYNSLPIDIGMGDDKVALGGWQFAHLGQSLTLLTYELTSEKINHRAQWDASVLFSQSPNYIKPFLNRGSIYINRPGQAPERFYFQGGVIVNGIESKEFAIDNGRQHIRIKGYLDGSWQYIDDDKKQIDYYNNRGQLTKTQYANGQYLIYSYDQSARGIPLSITDNLGNSLQISANPGGQITQITLPDGNTINYTYNASGMLASVQRPGYGIKQYSYAEGNLTDSNTDPNLLKTLMTGITDENGVRYATFNYDAQGRGLATEHANATQKYSVQYPTNNTTVTVQDSRGLSKTVNLVQKLGIMIPTSESDGTHNTNNNQYDSRGNILSTTQNGVTTQFKFEPVRNLETSRVDAVGTASSKITLTQWDANKPLKTKITEGAADSNGNLSQALRVTSYTYDNQGNPLTKTITDPKNNQSRTWSYTYNVNNQKLSETNPQGQVSQWAYDNKGFLVSSTDPQGLVTSYSDLNANGKPQTITSPTGQVTKLTYDGAGRVLTQTSTVTNPSLADISQNTSTLSGIINAIASVFGASPNVSKFDISHDSTQVATTRYQYDGVGQLIQTTLPDGQIISYQYDDAHRLIGMTDSLGNNISYTLNAAGDIIQTDSKDSTGQLAQSSKQSFDTLGRLSAQTGNNGQQESFSYDNQDNLTQSNDALSRTNQNQYDSLKRKIQSTDALGGKSSSTYNAIDQLTSQTDAKGVVTTYNYNAFGDLLSATSPDTLTYNYSYNSAGQLMGQNDGSGRVQSYSYDSTGRLLKRTDNTGKLLAQYSYDGAGRIASFTDTSGSTAYQYNSQNQVIEKKQTIEGNTLTTRYHYTPGGQLDQVVLPSGQLVQYQYNQGVLKGIQVKTNNNQSVQLVDNLKYNPNGITGYTWGQTGQTVSYQYDLDGRLTNISDNAFNRSYSYDAGNRITNLTDPTANIAGVFTHDKLDRLTSQNFNQGQDKYDYAYDANNNRYFDDHYTPTSGNANSLVYPAGNNLNAAYSYDGSGKATSDGQRSYSYNSEGRIERIQNGSVGIYNAYNALGQRVQKNSGNTKTYFLYDESGALAGEYDGSGAVLREYVYLAGRPIAMLSGEKPNAVLQVHTDHLGTPRAVSDSTNQVLWRWEGDAFGTSSPQLATIKMPLRMAGQYADDETGLFYNYFRFYDPKTGRYVENDPIGLAGGMNRWAYVGGSPLMAIDPRGLLTSIGAATATVGGIAGGIIGVAGCSSTGVGVIAAGGCGAAGAAIGLKLGADLGDWWAGVTGIGISLSNPHNVQDYNDNNIEKIANKREYERYCDDKPPPSGDPCEDAKAELRNAQMCLSGREAFTRKWYNGVDDKHSPTLYTNLENRIQNAKRRVEKECPCPN